MWDNHMHCNFSGDSTALPEEMIQAAIKKNLNGITFTDHLDIDYKEEPGLFDLNLPDYYRKQQEISKKYSTGSFTILTGVEVGLKKSVASENMSAVSSAPFDFVIGSTHVVDDKDPYYETFWNEKDYSRLLNRYYEVILENISTFTNFDTVAHLDYIFRYVPNHAITDSYSGYEEIVSAILEHIIKLDKALEINTGAFRKGLSEPNPCTDIIKRYHELGGRLITIGADAHEPDHIAFGFEKLPALLNSCGFKEYAVYEKRIPQLYPLIQ